VIHHNSSPQFLGSNFGCLVGLGCLANLVDESWVGSTSWLEVIQSTSSWESLFGGGVAEVDDGSFSPQSDCCTWLQMECFLSINWF